MSRCLNKATLIGYLGADPDIRTTATGARVAQLSVATTRRWNDRDGKPQEKTQWHRVVVWESLAGAFGFVERFVRKGHRVYVEGEIDYRSYEDAAGATRWTTEIKASEVLGAGEPRAVEEAPKSPAPPQESELPARRTTSRPRTRASAGRRSAQTSAL